MNKPFRVLARAARARAPREARRSVSRSILCAAFALCLPQAVTAATLIWDPAADQSNSGGSQTWDTTSLFWNDDGTPPNVAWDNSLNNTAQFSGFNSNGITVSLAAPITAGGLVFTSSGYTISGGTLTLTAPVVGTAPTIRVNLGESDTISSKLAGTDGFTKMGGGTLRLTNSSNSYTGITTISNGTVVVSDAAQLGTDPSAVVVSGSATRGFGGGQLMLAGSYSSGVSLSRDLSLQGLGPIADRSAALLSIGTNTVTGSVTSAVGSLATRIHSAGGLLTLSGPLSVLGTTGTTLTTLGVVNSVGVGNYDFKGALSGTGTIEKAGAGTLLFEPASTTGWSGTLRITLGTLRLSDPAVLGTNTGTNASAVLDLNGGIFEFRTDIGAWNKNVYERNSGTIFVDHAVGSTQMNTNVTFTGLRLASTDAETLTFSGRNGYGVTFTGNTTPESGATSQVITNSMSGTLTFQGTMWGTTDTTSRTLTINGNGNTVIVGNILAAGGSATHSIVKGGTGTLTLQGTAPTYVGTTSVQAGTLAINDFRAVNNAATAATAAINIGNTTTAATLSVVGNNATQANLTTSKIINLSGTTGGAAILANQTGTSPGLIFNANFTATGGAVTDAKTLTLGGASTADNTINGIIPNNAAGGTVNLTKTDAGTWVLAGANAYTGNTTITGGLLKLKANAGSSTIINDASSLVFNVNSTTQLAGGTLELTGVTNTVTTESLGALTPTAGAGTVTLTGAGAAANLTFSSLGATVAASSVNFKTTGAVGGVITLSGQAVTTATTLPGTANFQGHLYLNGSDFATIDASARVVAPTYAGSGDFQNASTALIASVHNLLTGSFTSGAATVSSLKATNQTLTLSGNLTISLGAILQTGGTSTIQSNSSSARTIAGSAPGVNIAIRVDGASDVLYLGTNAAPVGIASTTTAGLTKNGAGKLVIAGVNGQTGTTTINEGSVQLSGSLGRISATTASLVIRQGATLEFDGTSAANATVASLDGAGTITNVNGSATTLTLTNAGTWAGIFQDGSGVLSVTKAGTTGAPTWSGLNTYTGVTTIAGTTGLVSVPNLGNIGSASGIGKGVATDNSTNAASLVFAGTTGGLNYTGTSSVSTDRLFTLNGSAAGSGAQIANASANNSALVFSNTGPILFGTGATVAQTLTLGGTSTGDSRFNPLISDNGPLRTSLSKIGAGTWFLGNAANTFTGTTTITTGVLGATSGTSLPTNSPLVLAGGVFLSSGNFVRNVVATATPGNADEVSWTAGGGFAAGDGGKLVVAMGSLATPAQLTWGSGGFLPTGNLILNSATAVNEVEWRNNIDVNGLNRTIQVDDNSNTNTDFVTITGVISGTGGIIKSGNGVLQLLGANTYAGVTSVTTAVPLVVNSLGNSANPGPSSLGTSAGGNTDAGALTLGNGGTTAGYLQYVGPGETSDRKIRLNTSSGSTQIHADGSGPLILTNVANDMMTGAKVLILRGSNTAGNMITSQLSDNTGALGVTVDGGATWILTNPANNYTGTTTVGAGALGIGANTALGTGTLSFGNGTAFAYGGDRTLANPVTQSNLTTFAIIGDYSLSFTGTFANGANANSPTLTNSIVSGKSLSFADVTFNAITAARTWTINGSGDTRINGNLTTSTTFNLGLTYSGTGTLTLGGSASNLNAGAVTLSSGTLKLGANEAIPSGAGKGSVTIGPATGVTATFDLNGKSQTINGFTANSAGNIVIDNTSASAASLTFGANDQTVAIGGGAGSYSIRNSGAGALSITKTGTTTLTIPAAVSLSYTGGTSVTGGTMTIAAPTATSALSSTGAGSNLNLTGGLTAPNTISSVIVGAGSFLSLLDGVGTPLPNLITLNVGAGTGTATISLELGATSDLLTVSAPAVVTNTVTLNLSGVSGLMDGTPYDVLTAPSGLGTLANYILGSQPGGFTAGSLSMVGDTILRYTTGTAIVGTVYYNNTQATGSWATNASGSTNWQDAATGGIDPGYTPGPATTVVFGTTTLAGGPAITTTLDANFTVAALQFSSNPSGVTSWTINAGTPATSNLTIKSGGISVGNNAGAVTINPPVILGAAQTWNVDGGGANGSSLTIPSIISGNGFVLSKTGGGTLNLSGVNTFNGGLAIKAGTVVGTGTNSVFGTGPLTLGDSSGSSSAALQVNTSGLTFPNALVLQGGTSGTLSVGTPVNAAAAVSVTFSGGVTGANNLTINNQSLSGTTTFSTNAVNPAGTIANISSSTGTVTISGGVGSNVTAITQNSTTSALTISTNALTVNSGGTTLTNIAGTKILTVSGGISGTGNVLLQNNSALAAGITLSTTSVNPVGSITNSGSGTGDATISAVLGANVTGVVQTSATSPLIISGANAAYTGGYTAKAGILRLSTAGTSVGATGSTITLGDTSGTAAATIAFQSSITYDPIPISVISGSSGTLMITGSTTTGAPVVTGAISISRDLTIGNLSTGVTTGTLTIQGGITGTGNVTISNISGATGAMTFSTNPINNVGTLTNVGTGTGAAVISGGIGSNVTGVTQNSATSALTISGANASTGGVTLTQGTLNINQGAALGSGGTFLISAGTINNSSGAAVANSNVNPITIDGNFTFTGSNALDLGTGAVSFGPSVGTSRTFTVSASTLSFGGAISNGATANSLIKSGSGTLELRGDSTFTGGLTLNAGTIQFRTVSDNGGAASSLGQGTDGITFTAAGATLSFTGGVNQSTNRGITLTNGGTAYTTTGAVLSADGSAGATISFTGAIATGGNTLTLAGTGAGSLSGDISSTGTASDLLVNSGTWTLGGTTKTLGDDLVVTGPAVLNLNATGVIAYTAGTNNGLYSRNGATINFNAADPTSTASGLDFLIVGDTAVTTGVPAVHTNGFGLTTPRLDLGDDLTTGEGLIDGAGTLTVGTNINLYRGTITANLAGVGALLKTGVGSVTLGGDNTGLTGTTTLTYGNLILDFTANNAPKLNSAAVLAMNGGSLIINGNASAPTSMTANGLTLTAGSSSIAINNGAGQTVTVNLGAITRTAAGGAINFVFSSPNAVQTSSVNAFGTLLGGYATVNGSQFASATGGVISGVVSTAKDSPGTWVANDDITDNAGFSGTTGTLQINSLRFGAAGAVSNASVSPGSILTIRSGGILVTGAVGVGTASISGGMVQTGNGVDLIVHQYNTGSAFNIASSIVGLGGVTKIGPGALLLSGLNTYSGPTNLTAGTLKLQGGEAIADFSPVVLKNAQAVVLDVNGSIETIGTLAGAGAMGGAVSIGTGKLTVRETAATTYSGDITGSGSFIKTGASTLTLDTTATTFTGSLIVNQGQVTLSDRTVSNFASVGSVTLNNSTLLLSFTSGTETSNKINNSAPVTLVNTGGLDGLRANNDRNDATKSETVGALTLLGGANTITLQANAAAGSLARQMTITAASVTRSNRATLLVRGNNLGDLGASGVVNSGRFVSAAIPTLTGGGGAAGSPSISILPWAIGSSTASGSTTHGAGDSFVTAVASTGFRPLNTGTEYEPLTAAGGITAINNVRYSGTTDLALDGTAKTMNALLLENTGTAGITLAGGAASMNVASGAFLLLTPQPITITAFSDITTGGGNEYIFHQPSVAATATVDAPLTTSTAALTKSGAGTLILTGTGSTYTGPTTINQGSLQIDSLARLGNSGTGGIVFNGGTLRFGGIFDASTIPITFGVPATADVVNTVGGTLDTNGFDIVLGNSIGSGGNGGLTKAGTGTLTLNAAVNYTGLTASNAGTLRYGVDAALPSSMNVVLGGGTLDNGSFVSTLSRLTLVASSTIAGSADLTFTGNVEVDGGASRALTFNNSGTVTFSGIQFALVNTGTTARTLTLSGTSNVAISGAIVDGTAAGSLVFGTSGTTTLSGNNSYSGSTSINSGTVRLLSNQTMVGALQFGSANTITTAGTLDLTSANAAFGSLLAQTNSSSNSDLITIGAGRALTIGGSVTLGSSAATSTTQIAVSGGGAFNVNNAATGAVTFLVGGGSSNVATADFHVLGAMNISLGGTLQVSSTSGTNSTGFARLDLAVDSTISAAALAVGGGGSYNGNAGQINKVTLGAGSNVLNVDTLNIGTGARDLGQIVFNGPGGTLKIRSQTDPNNGRAAFNMGTGTSVTAAALPTGNQNTFDVSGHLADLRFGAVSIGTQNARTGALINVFSFDQGMLDMTSLTMGSKTAAGNSSSTMNLAGGIVNIGSGTGSAVTLASNSNTGAVDATINISGGTVTVTGNIVKGNNTGAGTSTATVILNGGSLNMSGFSIGGASAIDLSLLAGSLSNVSEINNGGSLTKSGNGRLVLSGVNSYAGTTAVNQGTVAITSDTALGATNGGTVVGDGATLEIDGSLADLHVGAEPLSLLGMGQGAVGALRNVAGNNSISGPVNFTDSTKIAVDAGSLLVAASVSGGSASTLEKSGSGLLSLTGNNTALTGPVLVSGGTLAIVNDNNLGDASATNTVTLAAATLRVTADMNLGGTRTVTLAAGGGTLEVTGANHLTVAGSIGGTTALTKSGSGTLILTGNNNYVGGTVLTAGRVEVGSEASLGSTSAGSLANGVTFSAGAPVLAITQSFSSAREIKVAAGATGTIETAAGQTFTLSSHLQNSGQFVKTGSGILAVTSDNSAYSGPAAIEAGTYLANNTGGFAAADITVDATGTLGGNGSVGGLVTVNAGGTVAPGQSLGNLTVGSLLLKNGSTFALELQTSGTLSGDLLTVTNGVTFENGSSVTLSIADLAPGSLLQQGAVLPFITYAQGAFTGTGAFFVPGFGQMLDYQGEANPSTFILNGVPVAVDYNYGPNSNVVALVAVPEPGALASLAGGVGMLLGLQRFRRRTKNA